MSIKNQNYQKYLGIALNNKKIYENNLIQPEG